MYNFLCYVFSGTTPKQEVSLFSYRTSLHILWHCEGKGHAPDLRLMQPLSIDRVDRVAALPCQRLYSKTANGNFDVIKFKLN